MKKESFVTDILRFYEAFLENVAVSIENLSKIQENHKEGYERLKEIQTDPSKLLKEFEGLDMNQRAKMLTFFMQAADFEKRLVSLFKLNPTEQKKLAQDLRTFLKSSNELIEEKK